MSVSAHRLHRQLAAPPLRHRNIHHRSAAGDRGEHPAVFTSIVAITDGDRTYDYPPSVGFEVRQEVLADYVAAAAYINAGGFDAVSLQHEFGIFGGEAGGYILALLERLTVPFTVTLHTVLEEPSAAQRRVLERIMKLSARVIVMAEKGRAISLKGQWCQSAKDRSHPARDT